MEVEVACPSGRSLLRCTREGNSYFYLRVQKMDQGRVRQYPKGVRPHANGIEIYFYYPKGAKTYAFKTLDWRPSPAGLTKAGKLRQEIVDAIKHDTFSWAKFFPDDPRCENLAAKSFGYYCQAWLDSPNNNWKPQSRYMFRTMLNKYMMPELHDRPIDKVTFTDLTNTLKLASEKMGKEPSNSTYNMWVSCLKGVFKTAVLDGAITRNSDPTTDLSHKTVQHNTPEPFTIEEAERIIQFMYANYGALWGAWYELGFYSGMRYPSEVAALAWSNVDFQRGEFYVKQIRAKHAEGGTQLSTKTKRVRTVHMNKRSRHALEVAHSHTSDKKWVFMQDSGKVVDDRAIPQLNMWKKCLEELGMEYRPPYSMRHTYATYGLMVGVNPAFMAGQLGHSVETFFATYAKWINQNLDTVQMAILDRAIEAKRDTQ